MIFSFGNCYATFESSWHSCEKLKWFRKQVLFCFDYVNATFTRDVQPQTCHANYTCLCSTALLHVEKTMSQHVCFCYMYTVSVRKITYPCLHVFTLHGPELWINLAVADFVKFRSLLSCADLNYCFEYDDVDIAFTRWSEIILNIAKSLF